MADDLVRQHWPHLAALHDTLLALTAHPHVVHGGQDDGPRYSKHDIDAIHEGLLRKNRKEGTLKFS